MSILNGFVVFLFFSVMKNILLVFLGGGIGAVFRYGLSGFVYRIVPPTFPYGTLVVNVLGSLLIGFVMSIATDRALIVPSLRIFLTLGVLGGFTTFSTFSYETFMLIKDMEWLQAIGNVVGSVTLCLCGTYLGFTLGRIL